MKKKTIFFVSLSCFLALIPISLYSSDYKYVASKFSIKYHLPNCKKVRQIQENVRVTFKTAQEATKAGYVQCGLCKPPAKD